VQDLVQHLARMLAVNGQRPVNISYIITPSA